MTSSTAPPRRFRALSWAARCALGLAVFQVLIAILLFVNRNEVMNAFVGHRFAPTPAAAQAAVLGALVVHLLLALLSGLLARALPRGTPLTRALGTILLAAIAVGGVAATRLPSDTSLSVIGTALALAGLVLVWLPDRRTR